MLADEIVFATVIGRCAILVATSSVSLTLSMGSSGNSHQSVTREILNKKMKKFW